MQSRLQYISCGTTALEQENNIRNALDHGADWVQIRWKNASNQDKLALSESIVKLCQVYQATCIINDSPEIAHWVGADGVHLGLSDESVDGARALLGTSKIIGGTANTLEDVIQRTNEDCDYIGLGPFRFTATKSKLSPILGLEGYQHIFSVLKKLDISPPPVFAIGGIVLADVESIRSTGIYGIAVSGMITQQPQLITTIKIKLQ